MEACVAVLMANERVVTAVHLELDAEYQRLDANFHTQGYQKRPPMEKLAMLRIAQQRARDAVADPAATATGTFSTSVITGVETNGTPSDVVRHDLPLRLSWTGLQQRLQHATKGWQAREVGFSEGYKFK